jgi:hypothetical protein
VIFTFGSLSALIKTAILSKELQIEDGQQFCIFARILAVEMQLLMDMTGPIVATK